MRLYATQEYLDAAGMPDTIADLSPHRLVSQKTDQPQVAAGARLVQDIMAQNIGSTLTVNNYFGVLQAVLANLGIGVLPDYLTADHHRLVRVLPEIESGEVPVFLAYPEELRQTRRVAVFRDFMLEEIQAFRRRQSEALIPVSV